MKWRLTALAMVLGVAAAGLWVRRDLARAYRGYSGELVVRIEPGMSADSIAGLLVERGVLAHRLPFLLRYWISRPHRTLKAGEYLFDRPLRPLDVYGKLVEGDVYLHQVVIPEGSDRFDIARILHEQLGIDPAKFLRVTEQTSLIADLDPAAPSLEGYLFPDTYRFPRRASAALVVSTMLARFRHILETKLRGQLQPGTQRLHDVVTLASLVEKETPDPAERPVVAGVFERRLEKGMPLQCDPTVAYAARLDHRPSAPITESDLEFDSPFNTYRHAGLPPGPIANPGAASLGAALHPAKGDALYFVSNNQGGHVFARTLAQHQRNVSRYRRQLAAQSRDVSANSRSSSPPSKNKRRDAENPAVRSGRSERHRKQKTTHP